MQVCEKALADYMESKRRAFPRFYFVSTADLLDILSNGNNPAKVGMPCASGKCSKEVQAIPTCAAAHLPACLCTRGVRLLKSTPSVTRKLPLLSMQVMQHMSKCFQAIGKLKLDTDTPPPGQRPRALGMVSCVGEEYVPFKSPLPLVDKVRASRAACAVHR